jgi:hypothetical protein
LRLRFAHELTKADGLEAVCSDLSSSPEGKELDAERFD